MNATRYAKTQIQDGLDFLAQCIDGMTDEQYNWKPSGTCNPVSKVHAHVLYSVDYFINLLLGAQPSSWGELAEREGLGKDGAEIWGGEGNISLSAMQEYAKSLKESVDSVSEADSDREIDTNFAGTQSVGWVLGLATSHTATHTGEISAVKGMQGLKGLPF